MTKQEKTHLRSNSFGNWLRREMPDSQSGTLITDIDFAIKNWRENNKILFLEEKTNMGEAPTWQIKFVQDIVKWINKSGDAVAEFHVIQFENYNFEDGKVYLDGIESDEEEVKMVISRYC